MAIASNWLPPRTSSSIATSWSTGEDRAEWTSMPSLSLNPGARGSRATLVTVCAGWDSRRRYSRSIHNGCLVERSTHRPVSKTVDIEIPVHPIAVVRVIPEVPHPDGEFHEEAVGQCL